jgi:hypothetical protein
MTLRTRYDNPLPLPRRPQGTYGSGERFHSGLHCQIPYNRVELMVGSKMRPAVRCPRRTNGTVSTLGGMIVTSRSRLLAGCGEEAQRLS